MKILEQQAETEEPNDLYEASRVESNAIAVETYDKEKDGILLYTRGIATCIAIIVDGTYVDAESSTTETFVVLYHWSGKTNEQIDRLQLNQENKKQEGYVTAASECITFVIQSIKSNLNSNVITLKSIGVVGGQKANVQEELTGTEQEIAGLSNFLTDDKQKQQFAQNTGITLPDFNPGTHLSPFHTEEEYNLNVYIKCDQGNITILYKKKEINEENKSSPNVSDESYGSNDSNEEEDDTRQALNPLKRKKDDDLDDDNKRIKLSVNTAQQQEEQKNPDRSGPKF
ncbi:MAG: hypothetical protein H0W44_10650 [Gammaproteobacteria bacterium]|nr:hypothetical protein [Gammaproteobacteria bacterium]